MCKQLKLHIQAPMASYFILKATKHILKLFKIR